MGLTERYLRAVAAQLPRAGREDIVAELRDELATRMEAREAQLGRSLTEAEEEAVLREMGHPLTVATRYRSGPQHLVGPELYPWWLFGVKAALLALLVLTALGVIARVLVGDAPFAQAFGQGFAGLFGGAMTIIGVATAAAFVMERQAVRPGFMTDWRVRDLGLFEVAALDHEDLWARLRGASEGSESGTEAGKPRPMSPTARALASAAAWSVFLLWWLGLLPVPALDPAALEHVAGLTLVEALAATLALLWGPIAIYAGVRIAFDLSRAASGGGVRLTAAGDVAFALVGLGFIAWLWAVSPLAPLIDIGSAAEWTDRVEQLLSLGVWTPVTVVWVSLSLAFLGEAWRLVGALFRLATGRDGRQG